MRLLSSKITEEAKQELPDYNTSINVHEHKLKRPEKPPGTETAMRWKGLEGLQERTRVHNWAKIVKICLSNS